MAANSFEVPCLGRSFQLGMLYDCCNDNITEGTLWNAETMKNHQQDSATKIVSNHEILVDDTLNEKYDWFDITGDIKLSCLVGLAKVSGSAHFLKDSSSVQQVRVYFKYWSNSRYEELLIDQLKDIPCTHDVIQETHVVTRIYYGADAIFVFDYMLQKCENRDDVIKFMKNIVENFHCVYLDANGDIKYNLDALNKEQNFDINKIKCKLYSDIHLESNPTTFKEAVKVYKSLLEQSSNTENTVPKKVLLYPLANLKIKKINKYIEISGSSITAVQSIIENLRRLEIKTNDLKADNTSTTFPVFKKELDGFATCLVQYKMTLLHELGALVPTVRSAEKKESDLVDLMHRYETSAYSISTMEVWLKNKEQEITMMTNCLKGMHDVPHAFTQSQLDEALYDFSYDYIVCFEFNVCGKYDEYLEQLYAFSQSKNCSNFGFHQSSPLQPWYRDRFIKNNILRQSKKFIKFFEANKNQHGTKYLLTHNADEQLTEGATIRLYENGLDEVFDVPGQCSKPELLNRFPDSLEMKWNHPNSDVVTNYTVYYCEKDNPDSWMEHMTTKDNTSVTIPHLQPDTEYCFKVCALCKVGLGEESKPSYFKTKYRLKQCSKLELLNEFRDSLEIKWNHPNPEEVTNYTVYYCEKENYGIWMKHMTKDDSTSVTVTNLQPDTEYCFKVCANCKVGPGKESELNYFKTKSRNSDAVETFKRLSKFIKVGNPSILQIPLKLIYEYKGKEEENDICKQNPLANTSEVIISKYVIGQDKTFYTPGSDKVLMLVGATGAGKTALINSMMNYLFGISFEDDFRLQMICENFGESLANSQTRCITSYTIHNIRGFKLPYPLTIVDTPGYGDTGGLQRDKFITDQVQILFSQLGENGIDHLDGVGFVVQSHLSRLTRTHKYIFDSILSLFGKDVENNIFIMVTFADAMRPPALNVIEKAKVTYKTFYTFNNSATFAENTPENENIIRLFWEMGDKSFENFFTAFEQLQEVSLKCTRRVLNQRKKLDVTIYAIQRKIELGIAKIEELEKEEKILLTHQAKIDANEHFTYTITLTKQRKIDVKSGTYVTNCVNCNFTCHKSCCIANDDNKFKCWAMEDQSDEKTKCRICPGRCSWMLHYNNGYIFELYEDTETRTSDELKKKYHEGLEGKKSVQEMVDNIKRDIVAMREDVNKNMKTVRECLEELNKIALRTSPLTEEDYLEMLIRSEKEQQKAGYLDRIKFYQQALGTTKKNIIFNALEPLNNFKHDQ